MTCYNFKVIALFKPGRCSCTVAAAASVFVVGIARALAARAGVRTVDDDGGNDAEDDEEMPKGAGVRTVDDDGGNAAEDDEEMPKGKEEEEEEEEEEAATEEGGFF